MLIVVLGSSGLNEVEGVPTGDPNALLQVVGSQDPRYVIVLCSRNNRTEAREQAHVLIAAQPRTNVAVLPLGHHPLTLTLIGASVREQLRTGVDPGDAVGLINRSAAQSRSLVWYARAWGLREPQPTAGQLLASSFRSPGYFRELGPAPALVPARRGSPVGNHDQVYVAGDSPALLHRQLGVTIRRVPVDLEPGQPWDTRHAAAVTVLVRADRRAGGQACPSCGARQSGAGCSFCGTRSARPEAVPGIPADAAAGSGSRGSFG